MLFSLRWEVQSRLQKSWGSAMYFADLLQAKFAGSSAGHTWAILMISGTSTKYTEPWGALRLSPAREEVFKSTMVSNENNFSVGTYLEVFSLVICSSNYFWVISHTHNFFAGYHSRILYIQSIVLGGRKKSESIDTSIQANLYTDYLVPWAWTYPAPEYSTCN